MARRREDSRRRRRELDIEIDLVDQIIRNPIVFQANGFGDVGTHQNLYPKRAGARARGQIVAIIGSKHCEAQSGDECRSGSAGSKSRAGQPVRKMAGNDTKEI